MHFADMESTPTIAFRNRLNLPVHSIKPCIAMSRTLIALLIVLLWAPSAQAQTAEDLFQQAVRVERLTGNTEAAIALYEQIVEEHSDERELVAKALIRVGNAYEAEGSKKAENSYRLVLEMYAELEPMASEAASGLARVTFPPSTNQNQLLPGGTVFLPTTEGFEFWGAAFSDDGSLMVSNDEDSKDIVIYDRATGESQLYDYAPDVPTAEKWVEYSRLSPDNSLVAFGSWVGEGDHDGEIRLLDLKTGEARPVLQLADYFREIYGIEILSGNPQVHDWTTSGDSVLVYLWATMGEGRDVYNDLAMVSTRDGGFRQVIGNGAFDGFGWELTCLSSDSKYVFADLWVDDKAYIDRIDVQSGTREHWREARKGQEIALHGCTKDGQVLYSLDRFGVSGLFVGDQEDLLDSNVDSRISLFPQNTSAILSSHEGDVAYYGRDLEHSVLLFDVDLETGQVTGNSQVISEGFATLGNFSPDGDKLVFHKAGSEGELVIKDIQSGAERTTILGNRHAAFSWAQDGRHIVATGLGNQREVFLYDSEDGRLVGSIPESDSIRGAGPGLTATSIMMSNRATRCFFSKDVVSGQESPYACLPEDSPNNLFLRMAANGTNSVAIAVDSAEVKFYLITSPENELRLILSDHNSKAPINWLQWAGENHIVWGRRDLESAFHMSGLTSLNIKTGETKEVFPEIQEVLRLGQYYFSPDGSRMVANVDTCPDCFGAPSGLTMVHRALEKQQSSN